MCRWTVWVGVCEVCGCGCVGCGCVCGCFSNCFRVIFFSKQRRLFEIAHKTFSILVLGTIFPLHSPLGIVVSPSGTVLSP